MPRKAVVSLTFPRRWLVPVAATAALGLAATPALADQARHREWWLSAVHVTTAWQASRGGGVTVAVLDSGVDPAQPDVSGSVTAGPDYTHTGEAPGTAYWGQHGTGMAALIAGRGHGPGRADGTVGIAPAARVLSVRVVPDRGDPELSDPVIASGLPDSIAAGIRYAAAHGATVIDLPLDPGTTDAAGNGGAASAAGGSSAERTAVRYALGKGAVLVAPAGDDRADGGVINYPAAYPGVMAVGAFDKQFVRPPSSSGRSYVTVTGPGAGVVTARAGHGYTSISSTAAASAVVAGMVALVRAEYPGLQPSQVTQAVERGARFRHNKKPGSGYGAADAAGALRAAAAISAASGGTRAGASGSRAAGSAQPAPAGPTGNPHMLRDVAEVAVAAVLILLVILVARMGWRRRRARPRPQDGPDPDSPLSGVPPPETAEAARTSMLAAPADLDRRPRLGPVSGLPAPDGAQHQASSPGRPPWEDAPMPDTPAPPWRIADSPEEPGAEGPSAPDASPWPGAGAGWPTRDPSKATGAEERWPIRDATDRMGLRFPWPAGDAQEPEFPQRHGGPPAADGAPGGNGQLGLAGHSSHFPPAADFAPGADFASAADDARALDDEDEQPFDDEDDRHL